MTIDPETRFLRGPDGQGMGDSGLDCMSTENNPGELTQALREITRLMETGWSYERAVFIRGHPNFGRLWRLTKGGGDARIARQALGMSLDEPSRCDLPRTDQTHGPLTVLACSDMPARIQQEDSVLV